MIALDLVPRTPYFTALPYLSIFHPQDTGLCQSPQHHTSHLHIFELSLPLARPYSSIIHTSIQAHISAQWQNNSSIFLSNAIFCMNIQLEAHLHFLLDPGSLV